MTTRSTLGMLACLALGLPARAADTGLLDAPSDVAIRLDMDPGTLVVGRPFDVRFVLSAPAGTRLYFPGTPATKPFVLVDHLHDAAAVAGEAGAETHTLRLLPVRVGTSVLAPFDVPYVTASGEARVARTPEVRIQVGTSLGNEADPQPAPAGTPVPVRVRDVLLVWLLSSLGVAGVAAVAGIVGYRRWRAWRDARRPPPPPRPADEVALEKLAQIEAMGLVEAGEFKELALRVTEVVREFLGARYGFSGVDLTSWEVLAALQGRDLGRLTTVELEDYLGFCDLVKFAKFVPTVPEAASLIRRAREVVEKAMAAVASPAGGGTP